MRKALVFGALAVIAGALVAAAAPLSGSWSFLLETEIDPFAISRIESVLEVDYAISGWTFSSTAIVDLDGFNNLYFDVAGRLGGFAIRSILDFDAANASFGTWLASAMTPMAGMNLYAIFMLDNVGSVQTPAIGSGFTLGGWGRAGDLSIWAQLQFNMTDTSRWIYQYGYAWLLDQFIYRRCGHWYKPSTLIDVQTSGCTAFWSGADIWLEMPFACFDLVTHVGFSCEGFDSVLFEIKEIDLGLSWLQIKWFDVLFTVDSKSVNAVFDLTVAETVCITPILALEGSGTQIEGIGLKALKLAYSWNGITFKSGHLFDEDGWTTYLNYPLVDYAYGWAWDGELTYYSECKVPSGYDEYFGLLIDGDACCGGSYDFSAFAWFDTGNSSGIFDWIETRANLRIGIGSNAALTYGMSVTVDGLQWTRLGFDFAW